MLHAVLICSWYDEGGYAHEYDDPRSTYRHAYFETLELAAGEVEKRFDHEDLVTIKEIETLLMKAANGETMDSLSPTIQSYLKYDADGE